MLITLTFNIDGLRVPTLTHFVVISNTIVTH